MMRLMKRLHLGGLILLLGLLFVGCTNSVNLTTPPTNEEDSEAAIRAIVEDFGGKLQMVSLLAPRDILKKSVEEAYGNLVSPALLDNWLEDPANAPGRLVSSPWPDRIEISGAVEASKDEYEVKGEIIEVTSVEKASGGAAAKRPITLGVKKIDGHWLINDVKLGEENTQTSSTRYTNVEYGFSFSLPESWNGYSIVKDTWEGFKLDSKGNVIDGTETGPQILIRHPKWTEEKQRQDIPIMVFTMEQWESLQKGSFHIGAAPVNPSEIGRNNNYVFALPARYNYSFPEGFEEVEDIVAGKPLQTGDVR